MVARKRLRRALRRAVKALACGVLETSNKSVFTCVFHNFRRGRIRLTTPSRGWTIVELGDRGRLTAVLEAVTREREVLNGTNAAWRRIKASHGCEATALTKRPH
jgi:hypothetical protein